MTKSHARRGWRTALVLAAMTAAQHATAPNVLAQSCEVVRFEEFPVGATWMSGDTFTADPATTISVGDFFFAPGACVGGTTSGIAQINASGLACRGGQDLQVNNVVLKFEFGMPVACVAIPYGEYGGTVSLDINGDCIVVENFPMLPPSLGGVNINVVPTSATCGVIELTGVVDVFVIGGQELWIDDIRFCRGCRLDCPAGDGGILSTATAGNKSPDLDGDGVVDLIDLTIFQAAFLSGDYCADFDSDGIVGLTDFTRFSAHFLHSGIAGRCCR